MVSIYGGRPYEPQIQALRAGADVVVGTPGRLLDLAQQGHLRLGKLSVLVLDEADEMLDLGFLPDVERILRQIPDDRQSMLFSATMPNPIIRLARTFMHQPTHIRAEAPHASAVHDATDQFVYRAHALDKVELVSRVLQARDRGATMIFTRTKRTAQKVADELAGRGFAVGAVHGDLGQVAREKALKAFRSGAIDVLVATDVAARGIDIDDVTHVINYQCPEDEKTYVHRIGRTGRAGRTGVAVTLVDWDELARWAMIDKALGLGCPEPPETYSSSPHLYTELGIPPEAGGTVGAPRTAQANHDRFAPRNAPRSRRRTRAGKPASGHPTSNGELATEPPAVTARTVAAVAGPARRPASPRPSTEWPRRAMVRPERRTRADMVAAAAIAVVVAVAVGLIWWTSDARATISRPAVVPAPNPTPARAVPSALRELWTAASPATGRPVVVGGTVVTGDKRTVDGRDPATGESHWRYTRGSDLCAVSWVYRYAVAVYRDDRGCGQVSTVDGSTGRRGPAAAATPTSTSPSPPTGPRCCRLASHGWSCGARTWSGCSPTVRSTPA
ncbi:helicase conserved C-terminal domain protein [Mycobacterium xenopi 4042]|uniref:RNA helicase n=1 Tax=Mycobacterium xenopi 4042 TaxID=1299334 RepID=X7YK77_MYCXE|nr:helicase conserved C-terminal domain protein [Mycobacterium xenopi 4042]